MTMEASSVPVQTRYAVLIMGCGNIAGGFDSLEKTDTPPLSHAGAFTRHDGFRIQACIDPDINRLNMFAQRWGVERLASDAAGLYAHTREFDVISICSPTDLHHAHLLQALTLQPRLIFCEKPLALDEASAIHMVEACRAQQVPLVVNYSRCWDPSVAEIISSLNNGEWGKIRSVVAHYNKGIINNGSHMVELLLRLLGPLNVLGTACAEQDYRNSDPTVAVLLTAMNGEIPVYFNPADAREYAHFELEIVCARGVIRMNSGGMDWQFREAEPSLQFKGYRVLAAAREVQGRYQETMALAVENIYEHLCCGAPLRSTGNAALQVQALCSKIQKMAFGKACSYNFI